MEQIIQKIQEAKQSIAPCRPPLWAATGHLQTIIGHLLPSAPLLEKGEQFNITLEKETERIHSTYLPGTTNTVVYLFHGLAGSARADYMQRTALKAQAQGHHVFLNNHRGCGMGAGLATEPYHSGRAEDLSKVIEYGRQMLPNHRHIAIGFSLSANALLLLAAKVRAEVQPDFAIAVNGPINLARCSIKMSQGLNRIYDLRFTFELEKYIKANRPHDLKKFSPLLGLREFDNIYTAPIGGFRDREDYYETCSSLQYLPQINIPTVILTAEDDPIVGIEDYLQASYSPCTVVHIEKHGGHMGYLSRQGLGFERWLDDALDTYLKAMS